MTLYEAVEAGDLEAAKEQIAAGEDLNQQGPDERTPLIEAARLGHLELVELLLEAGAEPMLKDAEQESAVLKAAANGHREVCALLMPHASDDERGMPRRFWAQSGRQTGPPSCLRPRRTSSGSSRRREISPARPPSTERGPQSSSATTCPRIASNASSAQRSAPGRSPIGRSSTRRGRRKNSGSERLPLLLSHRQIQLQVDR